MQIKTPADDQKVNWLKCLDEKKKQKNKHIID